MLYLSIAALLPALATIGIYLLEKKTAFGQWNINIRQITIGVIFGGLAIVGTEWGIPMNGAQVNCRDAAVVTAGLLFGWQAGILAGLIGGIERWIAVAWGVGSFTRVACTVSTILAGFYAATLRKYLFDNKKPSWILAFACGVVIEVFHLTMVFVTNMSVPQEAMAVVEACTLPMIIANGASVLISAISVTLLSGESILLHLGKQNISQTIQRWLLVSVLFAFSVTSLFVLRLQSTLAKTQADKLLELAVTEVADDVQDLSDRNMLSLTHLVAEDQSGMPLYMLAKKYNIAEINIIDTQGIITSSTVPEFIGYDMASGAQSAEFLCLLGDTTEFVQNYQNISFNSAVSRKYAGVKTRYGFLQVGYDAFHFHEDIKNQIVGLSSNRHVGNTGFTLIVDEEGRVVSAPKHLNRVELRDTVAWMNMYAPGCTIPVRTEDGDIFFRREKMEGYTILSVYPQSEAFEAQNFVLYVNTFVEILVFAILFLMIYLLIRQVVVKQIDSINKSLAKITAGNLDEEVNVRSNTEFSSLSDDINSTVQTLKRFIAEAAARFDKDLALAKEIQSSALPNPDTAFPALKEIEIYATMDPAKEVGGDFYDFYMSNATSLNFLIADVSGKGIPAAMFMMRAKAELKSLTEAGNPMNEVFTRGNDALCEGNDAGMFVTAWQGQLDIRDGSIKFANAGHNPPLVRHKDGTFTYLKSRAGMVLAGMEGLRYRTQELALEPGDIIYLYTDGVTEATNAHEELFGDQRLLEAINSREFASMKELCLFIKSQVDAFVGDAPQFDDITMVALKYNGK